MRLTPTLRIMQATQQTARDTLELARSIAAMQRQIVGLAGEARIVITKRTPAGLTFAAIPMTGNKRMAWTADIQSATLFRDPESARDLISTIRRVNGVLATLKVIL